MLECRLCGWIPKCSSCDVSLTYHKNSRELKCHYCNRSFKPAAECPVCHEQSVEPVGTGTEKLEEEVAKLFPDAVVARMDTDTTREHSYEKIIADFQQKRADPVGTQMLAKRPIDNVGVGIIAADVQHPDFSRMSGVFN